MENKESKLFKNSIFYMIGNFGTKFLNFFLVPIYGRVLSTEDFGNYDFVVIILNFLMPIITLSFERGMYVFLYEEDDDEYRKKVISTIFTVMTLNIFTLSIVAFFIKRYITQMTFLIILLADFKAFYLLFMQACRGFKRNLVYSIGGILYSLIFALGNILCLVILKLDYTTLFLVDIIACVVTIIYIELQLHLLYKYIRPYFDKEIGVKILKYSLPMIGNKISWNIMNISDRLLLTLVLGASANGLYAMANKFPSFLTTINTVLYLAWSDSVLENKADKDFKLYFNNMYNGYCSKLFNLSALLIAVNRIVFQVIVGDTFYEGYKYSVILYFAMIFYGMSSFIETLFDKNKDSKSSAISAFVGAILNFCIDLILLNKIGIYAAAVSSVIGFFVMYLMRIIMLRKEIKLKFDKEVKLDVLILLFAGMLSYILRGIWEFVFILLILIYIFWRNYKLLNRLLKKIMKVKC